ncbi:MAG: hypothetical protein U0800_07825 [Isosphaeraceae bacterium]
MAKPFSHARIVAEEQRRIGLSKLGALFEMVAFLARLIGPEGARGQGAEPGTSRSWPDGDFAVYAGPGRLSSAAEADLSLSRYRISIRIEPDTRMRGPRNLEPSKD